MFCVRSKKFEAKVTSATSEQSVDAYGLFCATSYCFFFSVITGQPSYLNTHTA